VFFIEKQGVVLTGPNTTGPPRAAPWWVTFYVRVVQTTDDDDRRQRPLLVCYTMYSWPATWCPLV